MVFQNMWNTKGRVRNRFSERNQDEKCLHAVSYDEHSDDVVSYWYNMKDRRTSQRKRKMYARRTTKKSRQEFNIDKFAVNESDRSDTQDESMSYISSINDKNSE